MTALYTPLSMSAIWSYQCVDPGAHDYRGWFPGHESVVKRDVGELRPRMAVYGLGPKKQPMCR